jgi:uncharacterized protein YjbI with pentapeptide repeats
MSSSSHLNYANQDLSDRSFKQQYLRGADFSGADIRGCDFSGANLIGVKFERVKAGLSHKQIITLLICTIGFAIAYAEALAFALTGSFSIAIAISLTTSVLAALTSPFALSLTSCTLLATLVNLIGKDGEEFSVAISIAFSCAVILAGSRTLFAIFFVAIIFSFTVALVFGFAGNLENTLTSLLVFRVSVTFGGIVAFIVMDSDRDFHIANVAGKFAIAAAAAGNCLVLAALAVAIAHQAFLDDNLLEEMGYILFAIACIAGGLKLGIKASQRVRDAIGTSFQDADLTGARFDRAVMCNTDFSGANLSQVSWKRARMRKFFVQNSRTGA